MEKTLVDSIVKDLEDAIAMQRDALVRIARRYHPHIQYDDLMQPQDYPDIDQDVHFRFEEGTLYGLERALIIVRRSLKDAEE